MSYGGIVNNSKHTRRHPDLPTRHNCDVQYRAPIELTRRYNLSEWDGQVSLRGKTLESSKLIYLF